MASRRAGAPRIALLHSLALDRGFWNGVAAAITGRHYGSLSQHAHRIM
jgi:hypothetical protein